jgi:hypothetical protein
MSRRPYTSHSRDRYRNGTAILTGLATFGAIAATGAVTSVVAGQTAQDRAQQGQPPTQKAARLGSEARRRPHKVVVRTTVVHRVSTPSAGTVGSGGSVSSYGDTSSYTPASRTHAAPQSSPGVAPAPAPSSGS